MHVNVTTHELARQLLSEPDRLVLVHDNENGPELCLVLDYVYVKVSTNGKNIDSVSNIPVEGFELATVIR